MFGEQEVIYITIVGTSLLLFITLTIALFFIRYERQKFRYIHRQRQLQTEIEIQEQTFQTISQEIHDNIGQLLSLAKLNLNTADIANDKIQQSKELISESIVALRDLSKSLNAELIKEIGLSKSIQRELSILARSGQYNTSVIEKGKPYRLDNQKELVMFRIFQETLNNIIKHSSAASVTVHLNYSPQCFELVISDDGIGFTANKPVDGIGLRNMQNRAHIIGARLELKSAAGKGTVISLVLPASVV